MFGPLNTATEVRNRLVAIADEMTVIDGETGGRALSADQQTRWDTLELERDFRASELGTLERRERLHASRVFRTWDFVGLTGPVLDHGGWVGSTPRRVRSFCWRAPGWGM